MAYLNFKGLPENIEGLKKNSTVRKFTHPSITSTCSLQGWVHSGSSADVVPHS